MVIVYHYCYYYYYHSLLLYKQIMIPHIQVEMSYFINYHFLTL